MFRAKFRSRISLSAAGSPRRERRAARAERQRHHAPESVFGKDAQADPIVAIQPFSIGRSGRRIKMPSRPLHLRAKSPRRRVVACQGQSWPTRRPRVPSPAWSSSGQDWGCPAAAACRTAMGRVFPCAELASVSNSLTLNHPWLLPCRRGVVTPTAWSRATFLHISIRSRVVQNQRPHRGKLGGGGKLVAGLLFARRN
jgi:hypothetical protein